jgi:hypothetical protein
MVIYFDFYNTQMLFWLSQLSFLFHDSIYLKIKKTFKDKKGYEISNFKKKNPKLNFKCTMLNSLTSLDNPFAHLLSNIALNFTNVIMFFNIALVLKYFAINTIIISNAVGLK